MASMFSMERWNSNELGRMLDFLDERASQRKLLRFATACCRRAWRLSNDPVHRNVVETAERCAAGRAGWDELEKAVQPLILGWQELEGVPAEQLKPADFMTIATSRLNDREEAAKYASSLSALGLASLAGEYRCPSWLAAYEAERAVQRALLHDLIGDPDRPFRFDPSWLAGAGQPAVDFAHAIEDGGRFDRLPELADVLELAGCNDASVLDHCRGPGPHFLGCWVLDALLGRESPVYFGLMTDEDWRSCKDTVTMTSFLHDKGGDRPWRLYAVACCRRIERRITDPRCRHAIDVATRYADGEATADELADAAASVEDAWNDASFEEWRAGAVQNCRMTPRYAENFIGLMVAEVVRSAVSRDTREPDDPYGPSPMPWTPADVRAERVVCYEVYAAMGEDDEWSDKPIQVAAKAAEAAEQSAQCEILRDLFGAHLGPPGDEAAWLPWFGEANEFWCLLPTPVATGLDAGRAWAGWNGGAVPKLAREIYESERFDRLPELADALEAAGGASPALMDHLRGPGPHFRGCWALDRLMDRDWTR